VNYLKCIQTRCWTWNFCRTTCLAQTDVCSRPFIIVMLALQYAIRAIHKFTINTIKLIYSRIFHVTDSHGRLDKSPKHIILTISQKEILCEQKIKSSTTHLSVFTVCNAVLREFFNIRIYTDARACVYIYKHFTSMFSSRSYFYL